MPECNGWANYETWSIACHVQSDEGLYYMARDMADDGKSYQEFAAMLGEIGVTKNADGVAFAGKWLDYDSLNDMMRELATTEENA
jgi:hypothetical protein